MGKRQAHAISFLGNGQEAGLVSSNEVARRLTNIEAGHLEFTTAPLITAWGRKAEQLRMRCW
jgi:hypothetical protein